MISSAEYLRWLAVMWTVAMCFGFRREIGAWRNKQEARKTLRIMHGALYKLAPELCTPECWE